QVRLVIFGDVVLGVLLEVPQLTGRQDALRDRPPTVALERAELGLERQQAFARDRLGLPFAHLITSVGASHNLIPSVSARRGQGEWGRECRSPPGAGLAPEGQRSDRAL